MRRLSGKAVSLCFVLKNMADSLSREFAQQYRGHLRRKQMNKYQRMAIIVRMPYQARRQPLFSTR